MTKGGIALLLAFVGLTSGSAVAQTSLCNLVERFTAGGGPRPIDVTTDGHWAAISGSGDPAGGYLHIVDLVTNTLACSQIPAGVGPDGPHGVAFSADDRFAYLVNEQGRTLYTYDVSHLPWCPTGWLRETPTDHNGFQVVVDEKRSRAYVSDNFSPLEVFDLSDPSNPVLAGSIGEANGTVEIARSPDRRWLYYTIDPSTGPEIGVYVVDLDSGRQAGFIPLEGAGPIAVRGDGQVLYVPLVPGGRPCDCPGLAVITVDPAQPWVDPEVCIIPNFGGAGGFDAAVTPDGARLLIAAAFSGTFVVRTEAQLAQFPHRPLDGLDVPVHLLDALEVYDRVLLVALGVDRQGDRHALALWEGPR